MYSIEAIRQKEAWETYLLKWPQANFLQSWNWGAFHQSLGKKVYYLQLKKADQLIGCALVVCELAKRGNYLTIAGGPLFNWTDPDIDALISFFLEHLQKIAKDHQAAFIRIRLQEPETQSLHETMNRHGWLRSPMHLTADLTLQLDLTKTEAELLSEMRKNTRYEIKKAERENISVVLSENPADIPAFYQAQLAVATKQKFVPFSLSFLKQQFEAFNQDHQVLLIHAYQNDTLLATAFVIFYGSEAVYHYGISTEANSRLPGSYACQWAAIKEAKKRGQLRYNLWGINPANEPSHRFAGVGLFKRGFGGQEVAYLPAYDSPTSLRYYPIRFFEQMRKKYRHL